LERIPKSEDWRSSGFGRLETGAIEIGASGAGGKQTMSTITPTRPASPTDPAGGGRIRVDEYERMTLDDPRVELIDGILVTKMAKKPPHIWTVRALIRNLRGHIPAGWFLAKEDPIRIPGFDEPEPDVSVIRGTEEDYQERIAEGNDVALVIEASDTTLLQDRGAKKSAYARARIPVYWIVNLVDRQVEVYSRPGKRGYASRQVFQPGQQGPVVIAGQQVGAIAVNDILPSRPPQRP
jgi:Uma2 family endonuclease